MIGINPSGLSRYSDQNLDSPGAWDVFNQLLQKVSIFHALVLQIVLFFFLLKTRYSGLLIQSCIVRLNFI